MEASRPALEQETMAQIASFLRGRVDMEGCLMKLANFVVGCASCQ